MTATIHPWVKDATQPAYDRNRGQEGSLRHTYTDPDRPAITYDWRRGGCVIRFNGSIIGMATERGGLYGATLKIGSQKIDRTNLNGIRALWLFVDLWVSSVTACAEPQQPKAPEPPRMGRWLDQVAAERGEIKEAAQ